MRPVAMRHQSSSNTNASAAPNSGTLGGRSSMGRPGRPQLMIGDEKYLWILVVLEAFVTVILRKKFRRYHGG